VQILILSQTNCVTLDVSKKSLGLYFSFLSEIK
jgi:hypothetical protein